MTRQLTEAQREAKNARRRAERRATSNLPDGPPYPCPHCGQDVDTPQGWSAHVRRHNEDVTANSLVRSNRLDRRYL